MTDHPRYLYEYMVFAMLTGLYQMREPDMHFADDGSCLFTWDEGEHHLEAELFPDGRVEWFYMNRTTGALWELDVEARSPMIPRVLRKISAFGFDPTGGRDGNDQPQ